MPTPQEVKALVEWTSYPPILSLIVTIYIRMHKKLTRIVISSGQYSSIYF